MAGFQKKKRAYGRAKARASLLNISFLLLNIYSFFLFLSSPLALQPSVIFYVRRRRCYVRIPD